MEVYRDLARPIIDRLDSETMHVAAREALHYSEVIPGGLNALEFLLTYQRQRFVDPRLAVSVDGIETDNPLIVGAGWDKKARAVAALIRLGFGGAVIGTLTPWDQDGNPKPRQVAIKGIADNWLGFNNDGMNKAEKNLRHYAVIDSQGNIIGMRFPIGISLGKNKEVPDIHAPLMYSLVAERLYKYATWFEINVSSPNTPGLRALQNKKPLIEISNALVETMLRMGGRIPWFIKIASDMNLAELDDVIEVALELGATGIIIGNTTVNKAIKEKYGWGDLPGGFSGDDPDFRMMSNVLIAHTYRQTNGRLYTMGVGGVKDGPTALEKIKAGASFVQVVTAIRGQGPSMPGRTNRQILAYMDQVGVNNISELVGVSAHSY